MLTNNTFTMKSLILAQDEPLATGLTHASRGAAFQFACKLEMATGARVSNTYPTCR